MTVKNGDMKKKMTSQTMAIIFMSGTSETISL